ncbi:MAG: NAD(P)/FAD-dependent oxidoreductase [Candidatus Babeliales bacterium]
MKTRFQPQDQVFWYLQRNGTKQLQESLETDVVVIGGGMAGLSAAQAFRERGKNVILLEQYYCGAGASGKSSGFITPNAELSLTNFIKKYNVNAAQGIWKHINSGVTFIKNNIDTYGIKCDYIPQDTLFMANHKRSMKSLYEEYLNLEKFGYKSFFLEKEDVRTYLNTDAYYGGVGYRDSFGIDAYAYCQGMKSILKDQGVQIFEETPVIAIEDHRVDTLHASVKAEHIIVCADRFIPHLGKLKGKIYQIQTFLLLSSVLTQEQIQGIFPQQQYMVWDSDLIYTYFRLTAHSRLLLGGSNLLQSYTFQSVHLYQLLIGKLNSYLHHVFGLNLQFESMWAGLIGMSKDIVPIAGRDKDNPSMYYIGACAGLPIAAALGNYSAEHILEKRRDLDTHFSPYRSFPIGSLLGKILGNKASFGLSNLITKIKFH